MKVRLLRKLRSQAVKLGFSSPELQFAPLEHCKLRFPEKTTFHTWFGCKFMYLLWYYGDGFCSNIRYKYQKYTSKWKVLHGKKLGIKSEKPFL